jgi:hypothetical protein
MGLVSLGSRVMWSQSITENISGIPEGSTWGFTMLTAMCFQFSMLNIYHAYGWPWKGQQRHYAIIHLLALTLLGSCRAKGGAPGDTAML